MVRTWLNAITFRDPIEQRQAPLMQIFLLGIIIGAPLVVLTFAGTVGLVGGVRYVALAALLVIPFAVIALALLRRDRFRSAILTTAVGLVLAVAIAIVPLGTLSGAPLAIAFALPIALTGLLATRRALMLVAGCSIAIMLLMAVLEPYLPQAIGFAPLPDQSGIPVSVTFAVVIVILIAFLDQFGGSLRSALSETQARERELDAIRAGLETTVAARTASLQTALDEVAQRETRLATTLAELRTSQDTIRELSAPVIPVLPGVLVVPLIGAIDSARAVVLTENVLQSIENRQTRAIIFDVTGVPIIDTHVAQVMFRTATAAQLLGARVLLVGIRPEVAQTMVALNIHLGAITAFPDLQNAIESLLPTTGWQRCRPGMLTEESAPVS